MAFLSGFACLIYPMFYGQNKTGLGLISSKLL